MYSPAARIGLLLVDDQTLIRQAIAEVLRCVEDVEIVGTAGNIQEALAMAQQRRPDVVLLDLLSESCPFAAAREMAQGWPNVKIILLDEQPSDMNAREALRIRVQGYLTKMQPLSQIVSSLRQVMRGERVFAPEIAHRLVMSPDGLRLTYGDTESALALLTPREIDVLIHLAQGRSVKECADLLGIGANTVGNHRSRLMKKLNVHKTVLLARLALREGLITVRNANERHSASDGT